MGKIEKFLINCGFRKAFSAFSNHKIKIHQITTLSERELEVLFPIIGERQSFKAAVNRKRIQDNIKKRKRDAGCWIVKDLVTRKRMRSSGTKKQATGTTKKEPYQSTAHSKIRVRRILKNDKAATSELIEIVNKVLTCHFKSLSVDSWHDHFPERQLIDYEKGKLNCPACPIQITPILRRLSPVSWKVDNFRRHMVKCHADLKDCYEEHEFTPMVDVVETVIDTEDSYNKDDWSGDDCLPIHSFVLKSSNNKSLAGVALPDKLFSSEMVDGSADQQSLSEQMLVDGHHSFESMEPQSKKSFPDETLPEQSLLDMPALPDEQSSNRMLHKPIPKEPLLKEKMSVQASAGVDQHFSNEVVAEKSDQQSLFVQSLLDDTLSEYSQLSLASLEQQPKKSLPDVILPEQSLPLTDEQSTNCMLYKPIPAKPLLNEKMTVQPLAGVALPPDQLFSNEVVAEISGQRSLSVQSLADETLSEYSHLPLPFLEPQHKKSLDDTLPEQSVGLEIALNEYTDDGHRYYSTLIRGDLQVCLNDTVYILRDVDIPGSESESTPRKHTYKTIGNIQYTDCDIFRVEQLWKDGEGSRFAFGHHYLRPHETFHKASKKFYKNELVKAELYEKLPIDLIMGQCWVLDPKTFCKGRPIKSEEVHVYICELKVNKARRIFTKISKQENRFCPNAFEYFDHELKITRNYSPHHIDKTVKKD